MKLKYFHKLPNWLSLLLKVFVGYLFLIGLSLMTALLASTLTLNSLKNHNFKTVSQQTRLARASITLANTLTLNQWPLVSAWKDGLVLVNQAQEIHSQLESSLKTVHADDTVLVSPQLAHQFTQLKNQYQLFYLKFKQSWLLQTFIPDQRQQQLVQAAQTLPEITWLANYLSTHQLNILFLLQNSDELRAGGGFVGSMAVASLNQGQLQQPVFYDIYDFANRVEPAPNPPIGIKKYLSQGGGMSLTDANWEVEFSQSAQHYINLIQETELPQINIVIGISLEFIEDLLKAIGPVQLLDSDQAVYADNLAQLARQDREDFFAGDKRKKIFLQELYSALRLQLANLSLEQQLALLETINTNIQKKNLQFYASDPELQQRFVDHDAAGVINTSTDFFLYLPESNVGINKANSQVTREVAIKFQPELLTIKITFFNENQPLSSQQLETIRSNPDLLQAEHMGYINYQRVVTNLPIEQTQIICDGQEILVEENTPIQTWSGKARQLGFLVKVPELSSLRCSIALAPSTQIRPNHTWTIIRQPGLPATPYRLDHFEQTHETILTSNQIF